MPSRLVDETKLTKSEHRVAEMSAKTSLSQKEMADKFFITVKSLKFHLTNIYRKFGVRGRVELKKSYYDKGHVWDALEGTDSLVPYPPEGLE